jgi:cell division protein FtsL
MPFEVVFEKRINNVNVRRDVDVDQRRQYLLVTCLSALFVLGLLLYGWQQYRWIDLGYQIEAAKVKKEKLIDYQKLLVLERNSQARDERIDLIARNELGMVVAAPGQIVTLRSNVPFPAEDAAEAPMSAAKR